MTLFGSLLGRVHVVRRLGIPFANIFSGWAQRVAFGISILLVASSAPAASDFIWTNTASSGYFTNPAVWSVNGTPGLNDNVWLTNNSVYTIWGSNNAA